MSVVDNCILTYGWLESGELIDKVNQFFSCKGFVSIDDNSLPHGWYGGSKMMEARLYLAAFNHFNEKEFISQLKSIDWECPEKVQLIIKRENDEKFSVINIFD
ncbi:MAG TPA: hypothetical protein VMV58_05345 [Desulfosporosinus sp.]|nr:hypothetical protein [Desulfosporosinus sp.]